MTVGELQLILNQYPGNIDVFLAERRTDFGFGLLNSVRKQEIGFKEDPNGETLATDTVIVLDEE